MAAASDGRVVRSLDLSGPFGTRSPWRIVATQAPDEPDPIMGDGQVEGRVTLCLTHDAGRTCDGGPVGMLRLGGNGGDAYDQPHELRRLAIVRPRSGQPLLLIQVGSLHGVNGDQRIGTDLYAYRRAEDRFRRVFRQRTNRNNNQEIRYVDAGRLAGAVIAAEPTSDAPFGYWVTVNRQDAAGRYQPVLRYRSATRYGDGNPLSVIDAELPGIEQRLGLWRPGQPLPRLDGCMRPRLRRGALWCDMGR